MCLIICHLSVNLTPYGNSKNYFTSILYDILQTRQEHIRLVHRIHCNIVCSYLQKGANLGENRTNFQARLTKIDFQKYFEGICFLGTYGVEAKKIHFSMLN